MFGPTNHKIVEEMADFNDEDKVVSCEINDRDEVLNALKTFLGKGR